MPNRPDVLHYTAFSDRPDGGNPAGIVLDATAMSAAQMQALAAELGYSESAFLTGPIGTSAAIPSRYFAPEGEVPFCGHATIATAAAIAEHVAPGRYRLDTQAGPVAVEGQIGDGGVRGALDSPPTGHLPLADADLDALLAALGWSRADLHPDFTPGIGTASNLHPVLVAADLDRLARLDYDFAALQRLCREREWITVQLITPTGPRLWRARDPFPYGNVVEDAATGSAAAAFSGYLRGLGRLTAGDEFTIEQGVEMGRPSRIDVRALDDRARVSGPAVALPG